MFNKSFFLEDDITPIDETNEHLSNGLVLDEAIKKQAENLFGLDEYVDDNGIYHLRLFIPENELEDEVWDVYEYVDGSALLEIGIMPDDIN